MYSHDRPFVPGAHATAVGTADGDGVGNREFKTSNVVTFTSSPG